LYSQNSTSDLRAPAFPRYYLAVPDSALPPELVAEYLAQLRADRDTLTGLLAAGGEGAPIRQIAHKLRGTGASFGFPGVTTHAAQVEDATPDRLTEAARALITHLAEVAAAPSMRVLLVDDDPDMGRLLGRVLARPDREIRIAMTARDADAELGRDRFDLIILDLFLADEDGRRLLARWRAAPATRQTPIFVLSAQLGAEVKAECFSLGADSYFEKPFEPAVLAAAVASSLQRRPSQAFLVPVEPPPAPTAPAPAPSRDRPAAILLADDDPLVASIVGHRFRKAGYRLDHVADGAAALRAIEQERPDLVILDLKMPELDGFGVLRHLRADPGLKSLPVIILTALGDEQDVLRGFSAGADDYLAKPFSPAELAVRVDRLLRRA
jgi:DNA-binding response OmpR family regulator